MHWIYLFFLGTIFWISGVAQSNPQIFENGAVFDGETIRHDWVVIVQGGRISYAGPAAEMPPITNAYRVSIKGHTLLPGMIEGHAHLFLHPYNETSWNDQVLKESWFERTVRASEHAQLALKAGFTSLRDLGTEGADYADVGLKAAIEKGVIDGPRLQVAGKAIVARGSYGPKGFAPHVSIPLGAEIADGPRLIEVVRDQIGHGADIIKVYADYRWGPYGQAMPTFSLEELKTIVTTAFSSGRRVIAHASTEEGMRRATLAGVTTIEHGDGGTPEIFKLMKEQQVALCPTLVAGDAILQYGGWKKGDEPEPPRIIAKRRSFKAALEAGVIICAGGDVGVFSHGDNVRELEMMVEYGMPAIEVLQAVTSVNARVFRMEDVGKIAKNFHADLIIVDGNPIQDISALRKVKYVMKAGQTIINDL